MDPISIFIMQLIGQGLALMQQGYDLHRRKANGETLTEDDLKSEQEKTKTLLAQGDALRSTPRQP